MKDPAFLFYSGDFMGGVIDLTMEERGQYITLLCVQHLKGHLSEELISRTVNNLSPYVLGKFTKDPEGLYFNDRLEIEIERRKNYVESRKRNRLSADNEDFKGVNNHMSNHMSNHMIPHMSIHMETETVTDITEGTSTEGTSDEVRGIPKGEPKPPADLVRERAVAWTVEQLTAFISKRAKVKFKADPKIIDRLYRRLNNPHYLALVMLYLNHLYDDNDPFRVIVLSFRSFAEKFEQIATSAERSLHKTYSTDKDTGGILKVSHEAKIALIWDSAKLTPNGRRILAEVQSNDYKVYEFSRLKNK